MLLTGRHIVSFIELLLIYFYNRKNYNDILTIVMYEDSSDQSGDDESQDDDFDILVLDSIFPPKTGIEGLMILLRRFPYPNRLCDLEQLFGRSETELSLIIKVLLQRIFRPLFYWLILKYLLSEYVYRKQN